MKYSFGIFVLTVLYMATYATNTKDIKKKRDNCDLIHRKRTNVEHNSKAELLHKLFEIEAIKEGEFTLASGVTSPVYIDLRRIISFPEVYQHVVDLLWQEMQDDAVDHVGGVPYAALPLQVSCF